LPTRGQGCGCNSRSGTRDEPRCARPSRPRPVPSSRLPASPASRSARSPAAHPGSWRKAR
jgi:hypothetical protein